MIKGQSETTIHHEDELSRKKRILILIAVAIGTFMGPLDSSVVNIALPRISDYFHATLGTVEWVVISYLLIISSLLLTYGRLGDMFGHKRIYVFGFIVFGAGSLLSALSPTILLLIIFRSFQAIGAGMMMAMGPAIVTDIAPPKERGKFMGIIAVSVSIALATGPVLGGLLTTYFGWKSIFYINVPIAIFGFIWGNKVIPKTREIKKQQFDIMGAIVLFIGLIALLLPLSYSEKFGWNNIYIISSIILSVLLLIFFVFFERKLESPMVDLTIFKNRLFFMGNLSALLSFTSLFFVILIMPFYFQQLLQLTPSQTGLMFIPMPLTSLIIAPISGIISDRVDARYISSLGMGVMAFGLWLLSQLQYDSSKLTIVLAMMTVGFGSGMFQTPNNSSIMGSIPKRRLGIASSILATMRNMGMVLGAAISGAIFTSHQQYLYSKLLNSGLAESVVKIRAFTGALNLTYSIAAILAAIAVITSLVRGSLNKNM